MSSNVSNAPSSFTSLNENDPLLVFLRSQKQCIKGSVDEFYLWLVKYENIESMMALKEAVSDDDYLNDTMRIGDRSYGVKGFKLSTFKRVVLDYVEEDNGDTSKKKAVHQEKKSGRKPPVKKSSAVSSSRNLELSNTDSEDELPQNKRKKLSKSKQRIISEDEEEDEDQVLAPSMPATKRRSKKQQVAAEPRESKKRKRFTEVEDEAIRLGVREYGVGKWAQIKAFRPVELADRTTTDLKDRWRTMNRLGLV